MNFMRDFRGGIPWLFEKDTRGLRQARGQRFTISGKIDAIVKGDTLRFGRITLPG